MVNFNQLRVFYHAARCRNFTKAAKELLITQPAVTAQVKLFENHCDLKLFKRRGRRVFLTEAGKTVYHYAQRILEYEKEIETAIDDLRKLRRGSLSLGTTKTYAGYFMPFLIKGFHEAYPHIKIRLAEGSSREMIRSLLDFQNEVAIIAEAEESPDVRFILLSRAEVLLILSPEHPLSKRSFVSLEQLRDEPIIMRESGSGTRRLVNKLFVTKGLKPNALMETSNTEFIKQLVQRGDGVSFLVKQAVEAELEGGRLASVPIRGEKIFLDVNIAYLKHQQLSCSAKAFIDTLLTLTTGEASGQSIREPVSRSTTGP